MDMNEIANDGEKTTETDAEPIAAGPTGSATSAPAEAGKADSATIAPADGAAKPGPFAGMKDVKGLRNKVRFFFETLKKYPEARQMVLFLLFSMLCGLGQFATQFALQYALKPVSSLSPVFRYGKIGGMYFLDFDSTSDFIGYLCGAIVGNALTFVLNRKKTFQATNNVVVAAVMYFFLAVFIICVQTLAGGWVSTPCYKAAGDLAETNGLIDFLCKFAGLAVGGVLALVINFLGSKYLVMRDWKKKGSDEAK